MGRKVLKYLDDCKEEISIVLFEDSVFKIKFTKKIDGYFISDFYEYAKYSDAVKKFNSLVLELLDSAEKLHEEDDILIENLGLSIRARYCLLRAGIETLSDLSERTIIDLMKIRNLGKKSLNEIIEVAREHGVEFKEK